MKTALALVVTIGLAALAGCYTTSRRGGGATKDQAFTSSSRTRMSPRVRQGETKTVIISLRRGDYFKRDVTLDFMASSGVHLDPTRVTIKASDTPTWHFA